MLALVLGVEAASARAAAVSRWNGSLLACEIARSRTIKGWTAGSAAAGLVGGALVGRAVSPDHIREAAVTGLVAAGILGYGLGRWFAPACTGLSYTTGDTERLNVQRQSLDRYHHDLQEYETCEGRRQRTVLEWTFSLAALGGVGGWYLGKWTSSGGSFDLAPWLYGSLGLLGGYVAGVATALKRAGPCPDRPSISNYPGAELPVNFEDESAR